MPTETTKLMTGAPPQPILTREDHYMMALLSAEVGRKGPKLSPGNLDDLKKLVFQAINSLDS